MFTYDTISPKNFYDLLQIPRDASLDDIKIAYRHTLLRLHPDKRSRPRRYQHPSDDTLARTQTEASIEVNGITGDASADPMKSQGSRLLPLPPSPPALPLSADMALVKEAYETLSDAKLREAYNGSLRRDEHARSSRGPPRPAQVVSLEEFTAVGSTEPGPGAMGPEATAVGQAWEYPCRCGGMYRITEDDLENGTHLVGCGGCSEVIWVGYEVIEDDMG